MLWFLAAFYEFFLVLWKPLLVVYRTAVLHIIGIMFSLFNLQCYVMPPAINNKELSFVQLSH